MSFHGSSRAAGIEVSVGFWGSGSQFKRLRALEFQAFWQIQGKRLCSEEFFVFRDFKAVGQKRAGRLAFEDPSQTIKVFVDRGTCQGFLARIERKNRNQ